MALAVDIKDRSGPSNKMHHQLQLKKTKIMLYKPLKQQQKASYALFLTNKMEHGLP